MASGRTIGCFGLTEPDSGSDPASMRTRARRAGNDWVLNGSKMWITNGGLADVAIVWAQTDDGVRGFVVPRDAAGFETHDMTGKLSLRASVTSELSLVEVRLPAAALLPEARGLGAPLSCLNEARYGIAWGAMGAARACFETALAYAMARIQFGKPIASRQLVQKRLVDLMTDVGEGTLLAMHLGRLKDDVGLSPEQVSFGKLRNVRRASDVARGARSILGANGISMDAAVMRHMANLESVLTYEGTEEIHTLALGAALTGHKAFA